ncbi:hypothetical protein P7K49_031814 [Saguinus oedipus]|uniref:Uncharacterized protein n=1 Tax=Saguinus oedipus TaxID=9490 RepID=A0ABQ9U0G8_SAGOE|nr:hypothetical protein P7K49_031814 [Saguinus oedipus]
MENVICEKQKIVTCNLTTCNYVTVKVNTPQIHQKGQLGIGSRLVEEDKAVANSSSSQENHSCCETTITKKINSRKSPGTVKGSLGRIGGKVGFGGGIQNDISLYSPASESID